MKTYLKCLVAILTIVTGFPALRGQIYVAYTLNGQRVIGEFATDGTPINTALVQGIGSGNCVTVSGSNIYITNSGVSNPTVAAYTTSGATVNSSLITLGPGDILSGIAVVGSNLIIADDGTMTVKEYTTAGVPVNTALLSGRTYTGLAISGSKMFLTDMSNIGEYTTAGVVVNDSLITNASGGAAIAVAGLNLYVAFPFSHTIGEFTTSGETINASLITGFGWPAQIAVADGYLFVTDSTLGTVGEYTLDGVPVNTALISGLSNASGLYVVSSVPEPATYAVIMGGLAIGAVGLSRRRNRAT